MRDAADSSAPARAGVPPADAGRLLSLDAFRGLTIAAMLLVNNPGSWAFVYWPLRHADWHGCTPTDLVFPFFLFIVGTSMALAFERRAHTGPRSALARKVAMRAALIFAIGLFLHGFPRWSDGRIVAYDWTTLRVPGVLPRIAWCYALVGAVVLALRGGWRWAAMGALVAGWFAIFLGVEVPGHGAGSLTLEGNAGALIDRLVFGAQHLYMRAKGFDPEGLASTLSAAGNTWLGYVFGRMLLAAPTPRALLLRWGALGAALATAGALLEPWLPWNKQLWTPSFMLWTAGWAGLGLAAVHALTEVARIRRPLLPFVMLGRNAILVYVLSGMLARALGFIRVPGPKGPRAASAWLFEMAQRAIPDPWLASLACALAHVAALTLVAWLLWRRRWFLRV